MPSEAFCRIPGKVTMTDGSGDAPEEGHGVLSDPGLLLTMEPARVLELLDQADDPRSRAIAEVYGVSADVHRTVAAVHRRQLLALDAVRLGDPALADWFQNADVPGGSGAQWAVGWASRSTGDPRLLHSFGGHATPVMSVAAAVVDGRPVAVSGGRDARVRVWDLATRQLRHELMTGGADPVWPMENTLLSVASVVVDGRALALTLHADDNETVRLWDLDTGRSAGELVSVVESTTMDGRRVVLTMGPDRTLWVTDLATGSLLQEVQSVAAIGVLEGRHVAVTTAGDRPAGVWEPATGRQVGECLQVVEAFLVEGKGPIAMAGPRGQVLRVWDLGTGRPISGADLAGLDFADAEPLLSVSALVVVNDRVVAMTLDDRTEPELVGHWAADYHDDGVRIPRRQTAVLGARRVALCRGTDQVLRVWDLTPGPEPVDGIRTIRTIPPEEGLSALSPDPAERADLWDLLAGRRGAGTSLRKTAGTGPHATSRPLELQDRLMSLAAEKDGTVTVLDAMEGRPRGRPLTGHTERVCSIDTVHTRQDILAVTTGLDRTVRVWDLATRQQRGEPLAGHTGQVWDVATTVADGRPVALTAGDDRTVRMWDLALADEDGRHRAGHTATVHAVATTVLNGDPVVVTAGADHTVRTWDLITGEQVTAPLGTEAAVLTTAVVEGNPVIVTADPDATLHVLDPVTGEHVIPPMPTGHGRVLALATATPDGLPVALTAGSDRSVGMWDLTTGTALGDPFTGHFSRVTAVAATVVDGRPLAVTGSWDKSVRLWDLSTGRRLGEPLRGHTDWVTSVATATVGDVPAVVTQGRDGTVSLWDLTSMTQINSHELTEAGSGGAMAVIRSADGRLSAAVGHERTVRFIELTTGRPAATDYLLPFPVHALTAAPNGHLVVAFGPEVAVLRPYDGF